MNKYIFEKATNNNEIDATIDYSDIGNMQWHTVITVERFAKRKKKKKKNGSKYTGSTGGSFSSSMPDSILYIPCFIRRPLYIEGCDRKISIRWSGCRDVAHVDDDNAVSLRVSIE